MNDINKTVPEGSRVCPRCQGSGECCDCHGTGHIECPLCQGQGVTPLRGKKITCHACKGTGQMECPPQCPSCAGKGFLNPADAQPTFRRPSQPVPQEAAIITNTGTRLMMALCAILYIAAPPDFPSLLPEPYPTIIWNGLVSKASLWDTHQYWRLITPAFLHGGLFHILCNMYCLWQIGPLIELVLGTKRFLGLYLASAFGGCLLSALMNGASGVGASGAIFGLAAALVVLGKRWGIVPPHVVRSLTNFMVIIVVLGFVIGSSLGFTVDNWGHIGGGLTGIAFAMMLDGNKLAKA